MFLGVLFIRSNKYSAGKQACQETFDIHFPQIKIYTQPNLHSSKPTKFHHQNELSLGSEVQVIHEKCLSFRFGHFSR